MKTKYFFVFLAVFAFAFFAFEANAGVFQFSETDPRYLQALSIAAAQEAKEDINIENKLELDEDLKPEDFGLKNIGILPTNPFYFIKGIRRGVGSVFTRDPAKKAELKLQYAAEKLLEAKEVAQKEGASDNDKKYAIDNFKDELEEVKHRVEIASDSLDDEQSKELSRKVLDSTLKYGKSLGNIEKNVSPELFLHVKDAKDAASEALASTFGLAEPGVVSNQLTEVLNEQKGSEFKNFKNLEVLKEVEAKVPQEARGAIKNAQENALNKLQAELEKFESAKKAIFEDFVKESGGSEIRHLEIINELEARPISKDLRNVILGAKEQVFSKAEARLNGLSQENKEKFAEHLGEGNIEDFRTLRELQNNISSGVISGISNVSSRAEAEFVKKIESTGQNDAQKKEFLGSIERFHDAKSISVLNEIEKLIPDDKKNFFAELKSKAVAEIRNDVSRAANSSQRQSVYDSLAGDHPEDFAAMDKFQGTVRTPFDASAFIEGIKRAQYGAMKDKIENISDKERLAKYEEEFKKLGQEIPDYSGFRRAFQQKRDIFESPEKALKKIEEAEKAIGEFRGVRSSLPYDSAYRGGEFDQMLRDIEGILAHAERKLETARTVLGYNDVGRAFGEAQSAENIARDGIALAQKYKSGVKETKCPFYYPPSSNFCANGIVVHQTDQNGCPLPPRCEFKEIRECPNVNYSTEASCPAGTHRESFKDEKGCYVLGKCVADRVTCQAYFEGYIFDNYANSCRKESASGCSDPFVYHTLDECTKAHGKITICPATPTVDSCPAGEHKKVTFSSPECGTYYGCEKDITIGGGGYCGDKICQSNESQASCSQDCGGSTTQNWIEHFWKFKDGLTERSMILNRTDGEYLAFISGIEKQCLNITKDKFTWKPGAGNDSPENWQNFGIPDCTGTIVTQPGPGCGIYVTSATCEINPACDWIATYCAPTITATTCPAGQYWTGTACTNNPSMLYEDTQVFCSDGIDNDKDGFIDKADPNCSAFTTIKCSPASACTSAESCSASGFYWYNGLCRESKPVDGTCSYSASYCINETECLKNNYYWCRSSCYGDKTACPTTTNNCSALGSDWTIYGSYCLNSARTQYAPLSSATASSVQSCTGVDSPVMGCSGSTTITTTTTDLHEDSSSLCSDGIDNDKDGFIDKADSSCSAFTTTSSTCSAKTDSASCTATPGCAWAATYCYSAGTSGGGSCTTGQYWNGTACVVNTTTTGTSGCGSYTTSAICESYPACDWIATYCGPTTTTTTTTTLLYEDSMALCSDGIDNDKDGFIDKADPSCSAYTTTSSGCSTPSNCYDSAKCTSSGWFWYNGGCWSTSQSSSNTTCPTGQYWTGTACAVNPSPTTTCSSGQYWNGTACVANTTTTTSCLICANPGSGCWYEGGSCTSCGAIKCSTTTTTSGSNVACNGNGICESGESTGSCPSDCH